MTRLRGDQSSQGIVIVFPEDSAELDDQAKERLTRAIPILAGKPQKIEIRGHASRRPLAPDGPFKDAWQLAYARCVSTMEFMQQHGIPPDRLRLSQAGAQEPYTFGVEPERLTRNSRVEVYMLTEFGDDLRGSPEERGERLETPVSLERHDTPAEPAGAEPAQEASHAHH
jgi:chemotaxis protein MotB